MADQVAASRRLRPVLLLEQLGEDVERWKEIIKQVENLPGPGTSLRFSSD